MALLRRLSFVAGVRVGGVRLTVGLGCEHLVLFYELAPPNC